MVHMVKLRNMKRDPALMAENVLKGVELEDRIASVARENGFIVKVRWWNVDVVLIRGDTGFVVECKNYELSKGEQRKAIRQLRKNFERMLPMLCEKFNVKQKNVVPVLVANGFSYNSKYVLQFKPEEFINFLKSLGEKVF